MLNARSELTVSNIYTCWRQIAEPASSQKRWSLPAGGGRERGREGGREGREGGREGRGEEGGEGGRGGREEGGFIRLLVIRITSSRLSTST